MVGFVGFIGSMMFLSIWAENRRSNVCQYLDVLKLDRKIRAGEIKQLIVREFDVIAVDRTDNCRYQTRIVDDSMRQELLADANEVVDGHPRVDQVTEEKEPPIPAPIVFGNGMGFIVLMLFHSATMLLMLALMPFYILLAVKNERLDQTMRIVWIVLFCTVGMFANPVYWYLEIWRKPKHKSTTDEQLVAHNI
jgi:hypothetical protein